MEHQSKIYGVPVLEVASAPDGRATLLHRGEIAAIFDVPPAFIEDSSGWRELYAAARRAARGRWDSARWAWKHRNGRIGRS
jgi:hypothetical protein